MPSRPAAPTARGALAHGVGRRALGGWFVVMAGMLAGAAKPIMRTS